MFDPNSTIPEADRDAAYAALLEALARDEPDALRRAAATIEAEPSTSAPGAGSLAATLARAWLGFTGNQKHAETPEGSQLFTFTYPAHLYFEVVSNAGEEVAWRVARRAMSQLMYMDDPLGGVSGPLPAAPAVLNLTVWVGDIGSRGLNRPEDQPKGGLATSLDLELTE